MEDALDKEVARTRLKIHKRKHDSVMMVDDDMIEGLSAGSTRVSQQIGEDTFRCFWFSSNLLQKRDEHMFEKPWESESICFHNNISYPTPLPQYGWQKSWTQEMLVHVSDMEDTDNAHIPKVSTTTWFKLIPEGERHATPEPE
ncbi:hypothetical protein Tco_1384967 [Tanacetum coccineum]